MADRVEAFTATCGAGTAAGADFAFTQGNVDRIEVEIPAGHAGLTSIIIVYGNSQVLPFTQGDVLRGDNETLGFDIDAAPTGSGWGALMTNDDVYAHSWRVRFFISEIVADEPAGSDLPILIVPNVL